ncbi:anti-sigma factor [Rhodococcoides corynebacterioides]|uniref:anti-sigma factor n=1 Tax=Rhodococcoides corynebacterioides TaxID=53972 RepID=UPI001C9B549B|nr:anti-sigma factor [Rhodococcus corynebacterioides]MBY6348921.1 anti-sigma factor [Rhodococcus corynebacterioides]
MTGRPYEMNDRAPRTDGRRREPDPDLVDLAYLCALDAMSASERVETMTRLGDDDLTRQRFDDIVRDIRETMAVSAYGTETAAPPDLRTRILGAAADTAQVAPDGTSAPVVVPLSASSDRRRTQARRPARLRWAAAAAAVVVAGVGGAIAVETGTDPSAPTTVTALEAPVTGGGTLEVEYAPGDDRAIVQMDGVDAPPAGSVYQLWIIDGGPVSAGTMDATSVDEAASVPVAGASAVSVTVEPTGGSPFPTSAAIARVDLT